MPEHKFSLIFKSNEDWTPEEFMKLVYGRLPGINIILHHTTDDEPEPEPPRSIVANGFEYDQEGEVIRLACMAEPEGFDRPLDGVCGGDIVEVDQAFRHNRQVGLEFDRDSTGGSVLYRVDWSLGDGDFDHLKYVCAVCGADYDMPEDIKHTYTH